MPRSLFYESDERHLPVVSLLLLLATSRSSEGLAHAGSTRHLVSGFIRASVTFSQWNTQASEALDGRPLPFRLAAE